MSDPVFNKPIPQGIESTVGYYIVSSAFTGGVLNDVLEKKIAVDLSKSSQTESKATLLGVYYVNLTQGTLLQDSEVLAGNITYIGGSASGGSSTVTNDGTFATPAKQDIGNTSLASIVTNTTGLATSANQTTANASLSTIATNTSTALGTVAKASAPVNTIVGGVVYSSASITLADQQTIAAQSDVNGKMLVSIQKSIFPVTQHQSLALTNTAVSVKATSGQLFGFNFVNQSATVAYVKFYNLLNTNVTVGTSAVAKKIIVPATGSIFIPVNIMIQHNFTTAISMAATLNYIDTDTNAPTNTIYADVYYN